MLIRRQNTCARLRSALTVVASVGLALGLMLRLANADDANATAELLMQMNKAAMDMTYAGTFVYLHQNQIESIRVARVVKGGVVRERLYSLNGAAREVVRDANRVWCYLPDQRIGVHEYRQAADTGFPGVLLKDIPKLKQFYDIRLGRTARIADRQTQEIVIRPKDNYRYGYSLWVDKQSGLLLRSDVRDTDGAVVERYMFADLLTGDQVSEDELTPRTPKNQLVWYGDDPKTTAAPVAASGRQWKVGKVLAGFTLKEHIYRLSPMSQQPMEHYVYTDGLAAVSVFIEKLDALEGDRAVSGLSRMGAVNAFDRMIGDYQITVVGEVPGRTVSQIADSIHQM